MTFVCAGYHKEHKTQECQIKFTLTCKFMLQSRARHVQENHTYTKTHTHTHVDLRNSRANNSFISLHCWPYTTGYLFSLMCLKLNLRQFSLTRFQFLHCDAIYQHINVCLNEVNHATLHIGQFVWLFQFPFYLLFFSYCLQAVFEIKSRRKKKNSIERKTSQIFLHIQQTKIKKKKGKTAETKPSVVWSLS